MKKLFVTHTLLSLIAMTAHAQQVSWRDPAILGIGKEPQRTALICYPSQDLALAGSEAASLYLRFPEAPWTAQNGQDGTIVWSNNYIIPFAWLGREVFIRIGSADASYMVSINGNPIYYSQDASAPSEFDVTKASKEGANQLQVIVYGQAAAKVLENWAHPSSPVAPKGVQIIAQPQIRMRDMLVDAQYDAGVGQLSLGVVCKSHLLNDKQVTTTCELFSPDGKSLFKESSTPQFSMKSEDTLHFFTRIADIKPWSAQSPILYTLLLKTQYEGRYTEYVSARIGFRTIGVAGQSLTVNGSAVAVRMENFTPAGDITADEASIKAFKQRGVNLLRLPHPQPQAFYTLCDRMGIYLCDQAGIDTSISGESIKKGGNPSNDPAWRNAYVERAQAMYRNSAIHPAVVMFSLAGDNSANGYCLQESYLVLKAFGDSRPVIYLGSGTGWNSDASAAPGGKLVFK